MDSTVSYSLVLHHLRQMDEQFAAFREDIREIKNRLSVIEQHNSSLSSRMDRVELRLDQIERRIDLVKVD